MSNRLLDKLVEMFHRFDDRSLRAGDTVVFVSSTIIAQVDQVQASRSPHVLSFQESFSSAWGANPAMNITLPAAGEEHGVVGPYHRKNVQLLKYSSLNPDVFNSDIIATWDESRPCCWNFNLGNVFLCYVTSFHYACEISPYKRRSVSGI